MNRFKNYCTECANIFVEIWTFLRCLWLINGENLTVIVHTATAVENIYGNLNYGGTAKKKSKIG